MNYLWFFISFMSVSCWLIFPHILSFFYGNIAYFFEQILKPNNRQPQQLAYYLAHQQRARRRQHPFWHLYLRGQYLAHHLQCIKLPRRLHLPSQPQLQLSLQRKRLEHWILQQCQLAVIRGRGQKTLQMFLVNFLVTRLPDWKNWSTLLREGTR